MLFYCEWFDLIPNREMKKHKSYGITKVKFIRRCFEFVSFIL